MTIRLVRSLAAWLPALIVILLSLPLTASGQDSPEKILLKDYRPKSIYKIPITQISRAKFRVIDMHTHPYAKTEEKIAEWVRTMDEVGIEKSIILTMAVGPKFDAIYSQYAKYPERFELWCGFDYSGYDKPGYGPAAVAELERCYRMGARGVGELGEKGHGMMYAKINAPGMHPDDPRMDPLFEKCAELGLPVNLHMAEPIWMYEKMDIHNDGLMNAYTYRIDRPENWMDNKQGTDIMEHSGLIDLLERTLKRHPRTTFIACHFAALDYDLARLGDLFERYPNLYADISARYAETATIPRFVSKFYSRYSNRLLYGTDMDANPQTYRITFRVLESQDEHFYEIEHSGYHWCMNGFGLPDPVLKRVYRDNALKILNSRKQRGK
jgi:predicted TIM-barrel fold metal-dependent hydrolase